MGECVANIRDLSKTFRSDFLYKRFTALKDLNLDIKEGSILGFLGPNGAGKTTTFKLLLGLMNPDKGTIRLWDKSPTDCEVRKKIGFLPENPYFYAYLTARESLDFYAKLFGINAKERKKKVDELIEKVGLSHAQNRQLRKFSRGMLQRVGIAQALVNDPKFLILDEPMSGLDPFGRKEMRDIIIDCKKQGSTIIFSTHILSDVEMICDEVAIIIKGALQANLKVDELIDKEIIEWEINISDVTSELAATIKNKNFEVYSIKRDKYFLKITNEEDARNMLEDIRKLGGKVISFGPRRSSLEDIFIKKAKELV
ncbi:MAG: ABC transporter ATP-binding protein [Desulfobacterales bacterium]|nr:ABC transporter ATP-binding protein [Desulfobacterales bacterium]